MSVKTTRSKGGPKSSGALSMATDDGRKDDYCAAPPLLWRWWR